MTDKAHFITESNGGNDFCRQVDVILDNLDDLLADSADRNRRQRHAQLLSFVIPVKDEEDTIAILADGIRTNIPSGFRYEIVFIDDGSCDHSWPIIQSLCDAQPAQVRGIRFRHNAGKATSLAAGFQAVRGDVVFTMDADLQDDPREIPRFLAKIKEGFDLVSGWKKVRHDPWHKVLPSRVFNVFASAVSGVKLHDHNCGFKCYRSEVTEKISLHGELHRVTPSLANMHGFRCAEIEVQHHPRKTGRSKYGLERILRGLCDVTTTGFLRRFRQRPAHFFNVVAGLQVVLGGCSLLMSFDQIVNPPTGVCILASVILFALAGSSFLAGLLAELVIRGPLRTSEELPIQSDTGILSPDDGRKQQQYLPLQTHTFDRIETSAAHH